MAIRIVPESMRDAALDIAPNVFDLHPAGVLVYLGNAKPSQVAELQEAGVDISVIEAEPDVETLRLRIARYLPDDMAAAHEWEPPITLDWEKALSVRPMRVAHQEGPQKEVLEWRWYGEGGLTQLMDKNPDLETLFLRGEHQYTRAGDPDFGVPIHRLERYAYVREDGTDHPEVKIRHKPYEAGVGQADEGEKRRGRLFKEVTGKVGAALVALGQDYTAGAALAQELDSALSVYVKYNQPQLIHDIHGHQASWLDDEMPARGVSFRQYMVARLWVWAGSPPS